MKQVPKVGLPRVAGPYLADSSRETCITGRRVARTAPPIVTGRAGFQPTLSRSPSALQHRPLNAIHLSLRLHAVSFGGLSAATLRQRSALLPEAAPPMSENQEHPFNEAPPLTLRLSRPDQNGPDTTPPRTALPAYSRPPHPRSPHGRSDPKVGLPRVAGHYVADSSRETFSVPFFPFSFFLSSGHGVGQIPGTSLSFMILPQVHLRKPCYDFYFL